jgi:hypothetical protein
MRCLNQEGGDEELQNHAHVKKGTYSDINFITL